MKVEVGVGYQKSLLLFYNLHLILANINTIVALSLIFDVQGQHQLGNQ